MIKKVLGDASLADGVELLIHQGYMSDDNGYAENTTPELQEFRRKRFHDEKHGYELIAEVWRADFVSIILNLLTECGSDMLTVLPVDRALPLPGSAYP